MGRINLVHLIFLTTSLMQYTSFILEHLKTYMYITFVDNKFLASHFYTRSTEKHKLLNQIYILFFILQSICFYINKKNTSQVYKKIVSLYRYFRIWSKYLYIPKYLQTIELATACSPHFFRACASWGQLVPRDWQGKLSSEKWHWTPLDGLQITGQVPPCRD